MIPGSPTIQKRVPPLLPLGSVCAALAVAWGGWQFARAVENSRWERAKADGPEAAYALPLEKTPESSDVRLLRGRFVSTDIFPADHPAAVGEFTRAVQLDPLSSLAWYELAKEEVLVNRPAEARAALERSDQLDPYYPRQRFGAIQLWATLGERERAITLARKIAGLGGEFRDTAAKKLLSLPMSPAEIHETLDFGSLQGMELADALVAVRAEDPERMAELWKRVDRARLTGNGGALKKAIRIATDPFVYDAVVSVWKSQNSFLEFTKENYPVDNPNLARVPTLEAFPLGWQPLPGLPPDQLVRWVAPVEGDLFPKGFIQFTFTADRPEDTLRWTFYRFPVPVMTGMDIEVDVRQIPSVSSTCSIQVMIGEEQVASAATSWAEEGWQALKLKVPPRVKGGVGELRLARSRRRADDKAGAPELHIGAVRFVVDHPMGEAVGP